MGEGVAKMKIVSRMLKMSSFFMGIIKKIELIFEDLKTKGGGAAI